MTAYQLLEQFAEFASNQVPESKWRFGCITIQYNENAAAYDRWSVARSDGYAVTTTRGATLPAAFGIDEDEVPQP